MQNPTYDKNHSPTAALDFDDKTHPNVPVADSSLVSSFPQSFAVSEGQLETVRDLDKGKFGSVSVSILAPKDGRQFQVALKQARVPSDDPAAAIALREKFVTEYRNLETVGRHVNIASAIGWVSDAKIPSYIMELIIGENLRTLLRGGNVKDEKKAEYCLGVATAVDHLHSKGILHRDLAARNVMVEISSGRVKLVDFGHSKDVGSSGSYELKQWSPFAFSWAAIECLESLTWTRSSDVWSVGVVIWEIYNSGAEPFGMEFPTTITYDMVKDFLRSGRRLDISAFPESVAKLVTSCWDSEPSSRPSLTHVIGVLKELGQAARTTASDHSEEYEDDSSN